MRSGRKDKYEESVLTGMEIWAWLGAYLVGFALLQLYLYRYFIGSTTGDRSAEGTTPPGGEATPHAVDREERTSANTCTCNECGTPNENDQAFTFCRNCGSRL